MNFEPVVTFLEVAAKSGLRVAIYLAFVALIGWLIFTYFIKSKAPKPRRKIVEIVVIGVTITALLLAVVCVIGEVVLQFIPKPPESATLLLRPNVAPGPEWAEVKYSANGLPFGQKIVGCQGPITVPANATSIDLTAFNASYYETKEQHSGKSPPWHFEIQNHVVSLDVIYDKEIAAYPSADSIYSESQTKVSKSELSKPGKLTDKYLLTVKNTSDCDIDLCFFNCRHFAQVDADSEEQTGQVTTTQRGAISIYPKWIRMESVAVGKTCQWD